MFQTFHVTSSPEQGPPRLAALREEMAREGLQGYLVPRADAHQGEYVAPCDERLAWLTGFTGSAGFSAVLQDVAGVFVDGRYRLQVRQQVASDFSPVNWPETQLANWLIDCAKSGDAIGFDPWLHPVDEVKRLTPALAEKGLTLTPSDNLIDRIWQDRPAPPGAPFFVHPLEWAGEDHGAKRARLTKDDTSGTTILTLPDSIAWLLNIRGRDIERNPVPQAFAFLHHDGRTELFARPGKAEHLAEHLGEDVTLRDVAELADALAKLAGPARLDPKSCPQAIHDILSTAGIEIIDAPDPCLLPKARKNPAEIAGHRAAQLRDGAAMVRFLAWLDAEAPKGALTEIDVVTQLEAFRRDTNQLQDISFETICGAGPHGAIVHYRVNENSNRPVKPGELLLVDSGGQYLDGTTDITRTIAVGDVGQDERSAYTRVAQGMIALSRARFPKGVAGSHLDALARYPLWLAGQDYDHGTGHGIGAYLSVHEGPQNLSRRGNVALEPGMMLSNEPGYYREGAFGIRIENLILVREADPLPNGDDRAMMDFETLTHVPLDRRLIDTGMLSAAERDWIDRYHADTLALIGPHVEGETLAWLRSATAPLDG